MDKVLNLLPYLRMWGLFSVHDRIIMALNQGSRSIERKAHLIHANMHLVSILKLMLIAVMVNLSAKLLAQTLNAS